MLQIQGKSHQIVVREAAVSIRQSAHIRLMLDLLIDDMSILLPSLSEDDESETLQMQKGVLLLFRVFVECPALYPQHISIVRPLCIEDMGQIRGEHVHIAPPKLLAMSLVDDADTTANMGVPAL